LKIREVMGSLDRNTVAKACKKFMFQIETVVAADELILSMFLYQPFFN
jgi:hypothetical protein